MRISPSSACVCTSAGGARSRRPRRPRPTRDATRRLRRADPALRVTRSAADRAAHAIPAAAVSTPRGRLPRTAGGSGAVRGVPCAGVAVARLGGARTRPAAVLVPPPATAPCRAIWAASHADAVAAGAPGEALSPGTRYTTMATWTHAVVRRAEAPAVDAAAAAADRASARDPSKQRVDTRDCARPRGPRSRERRGPRTAVSARQSRPGPGHFAGDGSRVGDPLNAGRGEPAAGPRPEVSAAGRLRRRGG
jgi:hypothetical protein